MAMNLIKALKCFMRPSHAGRFFTEPLETIASRLFHPVCTMPVVSGAYSVPWLWMKRRMAQQSERSQNKTSQFFRYVPVTSVTAAI